MQIKFQIPRGLRSPSKAKRPYHYWLVPEEPRKGGRLAQLQKRNTRMRRTLLGGAKEVA